MRRFLEIGGLVAAVVLVAFGIGAIVMSVNGRATVESSLKQEQIVGTPDMTPAGITAEAKKAGLDLSKLTIPSTSVAGKAITTGALARTFSEYMRIHALEATGGYVYSQMGIYTAKPGTPKAELLPGGGTDNTAYALVDPKTQQLVQNGQRNVWVTETALTTALNSAYMASQLSLFGLVVGVALLFAGIGFGVLTLSGAVRGPATSLTFMRRWLPVHARSAQVV